MIDIDISKYEKTEEELNRIKLYKIKKIQEMDDDRKTAWNKPIVGAFVFAFGLFGMVTMAEYEGAPLWFYLIGGLFGGLSLGWGLYTLAT